MNGATILVVEDDPRMQRLIASDLEARGYGVLVAADGLSALRSTSENRVDLVLLDISLPGHMDGMDVCRRLRAISSVPIILVTVIAQTDMKVEALEAGADDYITKPFHADELSARITAVLRRSASRPPASIVETHGLTIDLAQRVVRCGDAEVHLTKIEYDLLSALATHPDRVVTYGDLLQAVWGPGYDDLHAVHVHMSNLRRKLGGEAGTPSWLVAVPGVGYRFRLSG